MRMHRYLTYALWTKTKGITLSAFSTLEAAQAYRDELKTIKYVYGVWITTLKDGNWVFVEEWKMDDAGIWQEVPHNG